ncbi:MAG: EAL domain-containing protein [Gammaproteobacteria bacterium]|nr:MAG: EAL domain-containing protein [Gammaproteobacteria bacterium]
MTEYWLIGSLMLGCLGFAGVAAVLWLALRRQVGQMDALQRQVHEVAETAGFVRRVDFPRDPPELAGLGDTVNRLLDALQTRDRQVRDREALFADLANTMPEAIIVHRERIIFANKVAAELLGLTPEQLVGRPVTDLVRPAYRAMTRNAITKRLAGEVLPDRMEVQLANGHETDMWAEVTGGIIDYRGQRAVLSIARDISYRKNIESTLGRGKQQAQITLESIGEGVITADTEGLIDYMNSAAEKLTGALRETAIGKRLTDIVNLIDETDRRDLGDPIQRCLTDRRRVNMGRRAMMLSQAGGKELSIELTASPIKGPGDVLAGAVVIMHDVSEIRGLTKRMSYQATHDALTGLINRREFERRLEEALQSVREQNVAHVLCYLDLDRFKPVNDSCGHIAGDSLLRSVAALIREKVRESDAVARLGGDEFGVLLLGCPLEKARQIADDVCAAVRDYRFAWQDKVFQIGVSIGLVEIGRDSTTIEDLLAAADSACYVAKQEGRGKVHVYSARDEVTARQRGEIYWLRQLQAALKENRFDLHVQPILAVAGRTGDGPALEVFLRLTDEDGKLVLPRQFMQAAERYHLMGSLDRWVVRTALAALGQGAIRLPENRSCTINLSAQTLGEDDFLEFVVECLDQSQVSPPQICFEVTETALLADLERAERFASVLHGMGCQFGLDDFGSGVGALASLQGLDIDYLKIDGAFTRDLRPDNLNGQVVTAITRLAKTVGFRVIAEQVETQADFDALREMGVDYIQGHYVDRPHRIGEPSALSVAVH